MTTQLNQKHHDEIHLILDELHRKNLTLVRSHKMINPPAIKSREEQFRTLYNRMVNSPDGKAGADLSNGQRLDITFTETTMQWVIADRK